MVVVVAVMAVAEKQSSTLLLQVWVSLQYFLGSGQKLEMPQGTDFSRQISSEFSTQKYWFGSQHTLSQGIFFGMQVFSVLQYHSPNSQLNCLQTFSLSCFLKEKIEN